MNFVRWLSTNFCVKKPSPNPRKGLINTVGTLHHQFQWLRSGKLSSVVVVSAQETPKVQVAQKRSSRQKSSIKSMEWYWTIGDWKYVRWLRLLGISTERVHHILHGYLDMKKLSALWLPRFLTPDHKRNPVTTSKECLAMFSRNPNEFFCRFVTVDETWIHHTTPETKDQSRQWVSLGERAPKKAKVCLSAYKVIATVFWMHEMSFTSIT